jgi:hypothetical protein
MDRSPAGGDSAPDRRVPDPQPAPLHAARRETPERLARLTVAEKPAPLPGDRRPHDAENRHGPGPQPGRERPARSGKVGHAVEPAEVGQGAVERTLLQAGQLLHRELPNLDPLRQAGPLHLPGGHPDHLGRGVRREDAHSASSEMDRVLPGAARQLEHAVSWRKEGIQAVPHRAAQAGSEIGPGESGVVPGGERVEGGAQRSGA